MTLNSYLCIFTILKSLPILILMLLTFRNKCKLRMPTMIALIIFVSISQVAITLYTFRPSLWSGWARLSFSTISLVVCFILFFLTTHATSCQILFTLLVTKSYHDDMGLFVEIMEKCIPTATDSAHSLLVEVLFFGIAVAISFPLIYIFMERCVRPVIEDEFELSFWRYLWFLPASFYFIYRLGVYPGYLDGSNLVSNGMFLLPYVWTLATFLSYYVILRMLSEISKNVHLEEKLHISDVQISTQREIYVSLRGSIEDTRRLRHNIRHHLTAIRGYTEQSDCDGAQKYLDSLLNDFRIESALCENYAVDAIVRHFVTMAKNSNIAINISLDLPQSLAIPESDICVILGNLLENAVEACNRQIDGERFIRIKAVIVGRNMPAITVRNSYSGEIRRSGEAFLSSKRTGEGIGLASVQAISERYNGTLKFEYANNIFSASILLNPYSRS